MTFEETLDQVLAMLQRRGRVTYRTLKRQFNLDDDVLEDLKEELIYGQRVAVDEDGRVLVWRGETSTPPGSVASSPHREGRHVAPHAVASPPEEPRSTADAERRQITVMFCDLVDSTALASHLDPEELREVVRAYQEASAKVIVRFEGHIAQYLGDGLLIYFGYPVAHEDDAQRAVRAGLGIVEALGQFNASLGRKRAVQLAVRLGIHTGLVVVGEVGGGTRQEHLALGETPNFAARLQGIAAPNTLVVSAATFQLLGGFFACQSLGTPFLKGLAQRTEVYQVLHESTARSRLEVATSTGLTPLVGREQEVALLLERWEQVKDGIGQVVLLSGEAGIGKSRLVQVMKEHVATDPQSWLTPCQCSPYHQNTPLYPIIDLLERVVLRVDREESPQQKLNKLEGLLVQYGLPLAEAVPLFASLLSLPLADGYSPLNMSPEQQKQKTLQTILTILLKIAAQQPVLFVMEDLHWVDPSTLELLGLLVDQGPTPRILALLTFRPDFSPPWAGRSHITQVTLNRLPRRQAAEMIGQVAHRKALPAELVQQVVAKTDGVPLFVEELTKMVLESGLLQEREDRYELSGPLPPLAIPATLHDSLMARLDRLATVKAMAQLGATLGREFPYELLQAVSPWDDGTLQRGLQELVGAEFLYQRGLPPQATYFFKHVLIQEAAYHSMLRSTRQRHHQRIAQVVEDRFPEICKTQPELLAHHYTEAGAVAQAISYWQRAGERAIQRSAHAEAIAHLSKGLRLLEALSDAGERTRGELTLQTALGVPLLATKGFGSPEVEHVYARARELCREVGETPQLFSTLWGLWWFHEVHPELQTASDLAQQLLLTAERQQDPALLLQAHRAMGQTLFWFGELAQAREHFEQGIAIYDPEQHRSLAFRYGQDPGVGLRTFAAHVLWYLGYPDQALKRVYEAVALARDVSHPFSLAMALSSTAWLHQRRRDAGLTREWAEEAIRVSSEQKFAFFLAQAMVLAGWALAAREQEEEGIAQMRQGIAAYKSTGAELEQPNWLALLAEAYLKVGHKEEGLRVVAEALASAHKHQLHLWETELYRLKGDLLLTGVIPDSGEAESCLRKALDIARRQEAKSLESRAAISLSRLWQRQGKRDEARQLLAPICGWFTEGFETTDLREARALLEALS